MKTMKEVLKKEGLSDGDILLIAVLTECSPQYVRRIIDGTRGSDKRETVKAVKIRKAVEKRKEENEAFAAWFRGIKVEASNPAFSDTKNYY
jgi:hypothetical protein